MELFRLFGTIALDNAKANQGIDETTDKGEKAQSKLSGAFSKMGGAAAVCGKAVAAGMVAAGAAIIKIGKDAVASYADYEQLVGGVETLFKDSAKTVQQYAQNAYKTAGLSANEYMETVTSFSASLLQSLDGDTKKAAESANLAITDMSDNANKMGTSMESIQNAYQGFAKQNYTMLDNLKLGYGGTKEEMQRLLKDAEKISGIKYDISSFDDMVQAIHVVQTEMGITGTTAKEAATTIQGSAASMKSAWQNLLTGMADENQNLDELLAQFVDSVVTFADNLIPRIQKLLPRLVDGVAKLATSLSNNLPDIIETLLPPLIKGALSITAALIKKFPQIVASIVKALVNGFRKSLPEIKNIGVNLVKGLWNGISNAKSWVLDKIKGFGSSILNGLKSFFGIHSPSKVMEEQVGLQLALGVSAGIDKGKDKAKKSAEEMGKAILDKAEKTLTDYKRLHDMSAAEEASYWAAIVAQTKKGTDARVQAEDKFYTALENYKQQYESYVNNIMGQMKLFEEFVQGDAVDGSTLISNLQGQITGMESYYSTLDSLNSKIGGTQLMSYLSTLGTDNLSELQAINNMTDEQLQQYVNLYDQKYQMACNKATEALGVVATTTKDKTKESNGNVEKSMKSMLTSVTKYSSSMVSTAKSKFSSIASTIASNMAAAVASVRAAVAEMNAALASAPTGGTTKTKTVTKKANVKKNAAGGILTKPTIFGFTPSTGQWQLGGEDGKEAIAPIDTLQQYVRAAVADVQDSENVASKLEQLIELLQVLIGVTGNTKIEINGREFGRMVKDYA